MIATGYGIAVVLVIQLVAEPLLGCFTTDAAVVLMGCQYIRGYIVDTIFAGIHFSFTGYFAACGKYYIGFLHNVITIVLVRWFRGPTWLPGCLPEPCCLWGWPHRRVRCYPS